ncbi:unnamed protein product [Owenia fusiformis]|uniref:Uncharacterized protein n=1 Tax=Owenia fusiformis TaxID=6347 RepID=A0A8J1XRB5_OWEFU|nr:unnamed protein product [Owenia fusiformis]
MKMRYIMGNLDLIWTALFGLLLCQVGTCNKVRHFRKRQKLFPTNGGITRCDGCPSRIPASIIDEQSTGDVVKREGETVVLVCNVTGIPAPDVTWYRKSIHTTSPSVREKCPLPMSSDSSDNIHTKIGLTGEMLIITNASRYCEDTYECVADNGVAMPDSRIMNVKIEFAPEIHLPTKTMGQYKGRDTVILCKITAHPHRINFWELNGREIQTRTGKYLVEVYDGTEPHEQVMSLSIKDLGPNDFGWYSCIAANQFGKAAKDMKLYELEVQTTRNEYQEPNDENRPTAPEIVLPPGGGGGNSGKSSSTSKTTTTTAYPEVQAGNLINGGSNHGKYTSILMVVLAVMSNIFFQWIRT